MLNVEAFNEVIAELRTVKQTTGAVCKIYQGELSYCVEGVFADVFGQHNGYHWEADPTIGDSERSMSLLHPSLANVDEFSELAHNTEDYSVLDMMLIGGYIPDGVYEWFGIEDVHEFVNYVSYRACGAETSALAHANDTHRASFADFADAIESYVNARI